MDSNSSAAATPSYPDLVPSENVKLALCAALVRPGRRLTEVLGSYLRRERHVPKGTLNSQWVNSELWTLEALFEGRLPAGPTCRARVRGALNGLLRDTTDPLAANHIRRVLATLDGHPTPPAPPAPVTTRGTRAVPPGRVYVAILPTYYQLGSIVKVGFVKDDSPRRRLRAFTVGTGVPEGYLLGRVYAPPVGMTAQELEAGIHLKLSRSRRALGLPGGGKEWFRASLEWLDRVAAQLGARVEASPDADAVAELDLGPCELLRRLGDEPGPDDTA